VRQADRRSKIAANAVHGSTKSEYLSDADRDMSHNQSPRHPDNSGQNLRAAFNVAWPVLRLPLLMALLFMFRRLIAATAFICLRGDNCSSYLRIYRSP
jgi:hypothetical protein